MYLTVVSLVLTRKNESALAPRSHGNVLVMGWRWRRQGGVATFCAGTTE